MGALDYLGGTALLADSCSWEARSGSSEDSTYEATDTFSAAVTLACLAGRPSQQWLPRWPQALLTSSLELTLPPGTALAPRDRVTFAGDAYRVLQVDRWADAATVALLERLTGVPA
jgi:hypothetical protein